MVRIKKIEIQGFRAFGATAQQIVFDSNLAALWGPNSQGKSSLAEAMEFFFTGHSSRRDLLAGSADELADGLRNAHLKKELPVYVEVSIEDENKQVWIVRRQLTADYTKRANCVTSLTINGNPTDESCFSALGIRLSQPPMAAPILMQHTTGYLISTRPTDRAAYFKNLLEVNDLDDLRNAILELQPIFQTHKQSPLLEAFLKCIEQAALQEVFSPFSKSKKRESDLLAQCFSTAFRDLLKVKDKPEARTVEAWASEFEGVLNSVRKTAFPLSGFEMAALARVPILSEQDVAAIDQFIVAAEAVDKEFARLLHIYEEVLKIPEYATLKDKIDCPVCAKDLSLTQERISALRKKIQDNESYQKATQSFQRTIRTLDGELKNLTDKLRDHLPKFMRMTIKDFTSPKLKELLGEAFEKDINAWEQSSAEMRKTHGTLLSAAKTLKDFVGKLGANPKTIASGKDLVEKLKPLEIAYSDHETALEKYSTLAEKILTPLEKAVATKTNTIGWQSLLENSKKRGEILGEFSRTELVAKVERDFLDAVSEIEKAKDRVTQSKFVAISDDIRKWWDLLRPDEFSFFSGLTPRPMTQRSIDFKVGLAESEEKLNPQIRDAVAVFSSSQIHCLGLASFIAKLVRDKVGFVLMDDPVLSSDEDHRAHFIVSVIEELLGTGIQVIILTQDQSTFKDIEDRFAHVNPDLFQILINSPVEGSTVTKTSDALRAKLAKARPFLKSVHPEMRKSASKHLREAAERFCKELLVKHRRANGESAASINDYSGQNLGQLVPLVEPYFKDPSHPGKIKAIARNLNPGNHDDEVPSQGNLKVSYGDLEAFQKTYL